MSSTNQTHPYLFLNGLMSYISLIFNVIAFCLTTLYRMTISICNVVAAGGGTFAQFSLKSGPNGKKFGTEKATGTNEMSSETSKRRRGRPKKVLKRMNEGVSDCEKRHKETKHNEVKEEADIGDEEDMPNGKITEAQKRTMVIQEVGKNSNIAERNLLKRNRDDSDLVPGPGLHNQENGRLTEHSEKATCSVRKFYKRRCSTQTLV